MTGQEFVNKCKADLCKTQSRSKNGKKYHNKYTEYFGSRGYAGINSKGVFTKRYSYGVVGHCCIGVQYHLHRNGLAAFVPKKGYIWNTNVYRKWLKSEPTISGYGKVDWVTSPSKAKVGAIAFKGDGKNKTSATHTCVFIKLVGNYVYTVDFNVGDGKGHNNGTLHKRHKKYFVGFANMPYPKAPAPKPEPAHKKYEVGKTYTLQDDMTIRKGAGTNQAKVKVEDMSASARKHITSKGLLKKGTRVTCKAVKTDSKGATWIQIPSGWICAIGSTGKVFVK